MPSFAPPPTDRFGFLTSMNNFQPLPAIPTPGMFAGPIGMPTMASMLPGMNTQAMPGMPNMFGMPMMPGMQHMMMPGMSMQNMPQTQHPQQHTAPPQVPPQAPALEHRPPDPSSK